MTSASLTTTVAFCAAAWLVYQQRRVRRGERSTIFHRLLPSSPPLSDGDKFVGAWILSSYHVDDTITGDRIHPLGNDPEGLIVRMHRAMNRRLYLLVIFRIPLAHALKMNDSAFSVLGAR